MKAKTITEYKIMKFIEKNFDLNSIEIELDTMTKITDKNDDELYLWVSDETGEVMWNDVPRRDLPF